MSRLISGGANCVLELSGTASPDREADELQSVRAALDSFGASSSAGSDGFPVVKTYFVHGVHHILTGFDHLLFLGALVLAAGTPWELVKVVTAFTLAHSVTLTLAARGLVRLPEAVVEPLIAASIVFVAQQNIFWPAGARGRSRLAAAFFFGLFHGLGFAGGLFDVMHALPVERPFKRSAASAPVSRRGTCWCCYRWSGS